MPPLPSIEPALDTIPSVNGIYAERVPLAAAAAAQGMAVVTVLLLIAIMPGDSASGVHPLSWALVQGLAAAAIGRSLRMEPWWIPIHALFVPGLVWILAYQPPPEFALILFCLLASVYWGVSRSRVPLFLSSPAAARAVADLLPRDRDFSFLDLGCGLGGVLAHLARARPLGRYHGVELAPVPFLLCRLRAALIGRNCRVSWQDFNTLDLGRYEVIYAYLSPAAMDGLWEKATREMRPGSLLISNSFSVPGVQPAFSRPAGTGCESRLLVWRM
jgi:hypothetical protein